MKNVEIIDAFVKQYGIRYIETYSRNDIHMLVSGFTAALPLLGKTKEEVQKFAITLCPICDEQYKG